MPDSISVVAAGPPARTLAPSPSRSPIKAPNQLAAAGTQVDGAVRSNSWDAYVKDAFVSAEAAEREQQRINAFIAQERSPAASSSPPPPSTPQAAPIDPPQASSRAPDPYPHVPQTPPPQAAAPSAPRAPVVFVPPSQASAEPLPPPDKPPAPWSPLDVKDSTTRALIGYVAACHANPNLPRTYLEPARTALGPIADHLSTWVQGARHRRSAEDLRTMNLIAQWRPEPLGEVRAALRARGVELTDNNGGLVEAARPSVQRTPAQPTTQRAPTRRPVDHGYSRR